MTRFYGPLEGKWPTLVSQISDVVIFRGLNEGQLQSILRISTRQEVEQGAEIFKEGDTAEELYVILSGKVRISRQLSDLVEGEEAVAGLGPRQALGEMGVIQDMVRSATATAHEPCSLLVIKKEAFQQLLRDDRDLANTILWNVVRLLSARLRTTNDQVMLDRLERSLGV